MLRICFVKVGDAYGPEYVNILADCISRNLAAGTPGTFECFTDNPEGISEHITTHPIPQGEGFDGWWAKMWLFKDGHFEDGDRILYFDLDTVILGPLDEIVKYDGSFAILRDFFKPHDDMQSAVMAWPANSQMDLLDSWLEKGLPILHGGDQAAIQASFTERNIKPDFWQDLYPSLFVSYKSGSYKRVPPKGASVVCFHGQPKPHNCNSTWVDGVWQINGTQAFEIEQFCNTEEKQIEANIRYAMSLDYPWLEPVALHDGLAVIVGGAPSLKETVGEIARLGGTVFATNNTAQFLEGHGIASDYHVLVDARPENTGFISSRPQLGYLLASQCDRSAFDAIAQGAVTVWHPKINGIVELIQNDPRPACIVGGGSTVCLKAIAIAYILGYRKFHLFGMDSSYADDGEHHAYSQALNDDDLIVRVQVDDRFFTTSPWMVAQADEFEDLLVELSRLGCTFDVSGDGLIPYILREMTRTVPSWQVRGDAILANLPDGQVRGAEIGVFAGELSAHLMRARPDLHLIMVDAWDSSVYQKGADDFHAGLTQEQQDAYYAMALAATDFVADQRTIIKSDSISAATWVQEASLDFVFIDADHSYEGCKRDIEIWYPKLKADGLLSGHDYDHPDFPDWGVKRAVHEFADAHGYEVSLGENFTWFIRKNSNSLSAQAA